MKQHTSPFSRALRLSGVAIAISVLSACAVVTGTHEPIAQVDNDVLSLPSAAGQKRIGPVSHMKAGGAATTIRH